MYTDETLTCTDCGKTFTFSAGEQEFFASKGFANKPNRCPDCRVARRAGRSSGNRSSNVSGTREMHQVVCSECGRETEVPFMPRGDRPVYCRDCFQKTRQAPLR
ncbi:MAG: zinc-ribbon domain containing protein [Candidatus Eremiobacteraeota bacterium]|nr:zinc-ribbon domain containing protein [Candidatus Eremiobacteraeota bacterium]